MRLLFYRYTGDTHFDSLLSVISKTKHECGYLSGEINHETISNFNPDVIIHNIPNTNQFPIKNRAVSININESDSKNSFSLSNKKSKNYIGGFVHFRPSTVDEKDIPKFSSDILYIGTPIVFGKLLNWIVNSSFNFKFFNHQPHNISGYCGMCNIDDYFKFYSNSKASLVSHDDESRLMDIIAAGGNPIVYNGNNYEECADKIHHAVVDDAKYQVEGYSREDIISKHTSFDRAAFIFKTVGLNKIAEDILRNKKTEWCKK